jgi:hypothetical protein
MKAHPFLRHIAVISFAVFGACCASPSLVSAAPDKPPARAASGPVLHLDVVDRTSSGTRQTVRLSLPLAERGSSSVEARAGSSEYHLSVGRDGAPETPGPLRIDLRRTDQRRHSETADQRSDLRLDVRVTLQRGERALIARLERPDGSTTDVSAALR